MCATDPVIPSGVPPCPAPTLACAGHNSHACFPQSTPSHPDLDNGISFMSADDNDEVEDSNGNTGTSVPGAASAIPQFHIASDLTIEDVQPSLSPYNSQGDTLLYNNILLYHHILQLYEFNTS